MFDLQRLAGWLACSLIGLKALAVQYSCSCILVKFNLDILTAINVIYDY